MSTDKELEEMAGELEKKIQQLTPEELEELNKFSPSAVLLMRESRINSALRTTLVTLARQIDGMIDGHHSRKALLSLLANLREDIEAALKESEP